MICDDRKVNAPLLLSSGLLKRNGFFMTLSAIKDDDGQLEFWSVSEEM
jgi:hypothetical protein